MVTMIIIRCCLLYWYWRLYKQSECILIPMLGSRCCCLFIYFLYFGQKEDFYGYKSKITPGYIYLYISENFLFTFFFITYSDFDEVFSAKSIIYIYCILFTPCFIFCIVIFLPLPFPTVFWKSFGSFFKSLI